jgi:hypothetical protein
MDARSIALMGVGDISAVLLTDGISVYYSPEQTRINIVSFENRFCAVSMLSRFSFVRSDNRTAPVEFENRLRVIAREFRIMKVG